MRKRLRYRRVVIVILFGILVISGLVYMYTQRRYDRVYEGDIETYTAVYREEGKLYTFELKSFVDQDIRYVSLNDMYNIVKIIDPHAKVFIQQQRHMMTYQFQEKTYLFDYGHNKIVYNNKCIEFNHKDENIYVSHKNIYVSVFQTENLLLNNEKKVKFENKNAIIQ